MKKFHKEFQTLKYALYNAENILLVAHTRPDPDAVGSVVALARYIRSVLHKDVTIASFSPFPDFLVPVLGAEETFYSLDTLDVRPFDLAIGCDSVDRGFNEIISNLSENCVTAAMDHHHDITLETDISMIDADYASTTELIHHFFQSIGQEVTHEIAVPLLTGLIGDTGIFQHPCTEPHVLEAASEMVRAGASVSDIVDKAFANQKIETLNLWGLALTRAQHNEESGVIVTAITAEDLAGRTPTSEEVKEVATILANVPGVRATVIMFQVAPDMIKASIRGVKSAGIDVSEIAHHFGGGGHPLAAGFEVSGTLVATDNGWHVA